MSEQELSAFARTFLTFFDGGVPGEEILVHNMMIRVIEKLGFASCVPLDKVIYFPARLPIGGRDPQLEELEELDPEFLTDDSDPCIRQCLEDGNAVALAFPPDVSGDATALQRLRDGHRTFLDDCLGPIVRECGPKGARSVELPPDPGAAFSPPTAHVVCTRVEGDDAYFARLRTCNADRAKGWRVILLDRDFRRRGRNAIGLLQSVLALESLLNINHSTTFPRTLRDFHVGRELVLPTRDDLRTSTHLIDRQTALRFYETLDYYQAFSDAYQEMTASFEGPLRRAEERMGQAAACGAAQPKATTEEPAAAATPSRPNP